MSGMSPVAADCASADNAPGALPPLVVAGGDADVVVLTWAAVEAPLPVDEEPLDADPQPAVTIEEATTTPNTESLFMASRLAI